MPAGVCIEITHNHRKPRFLLRNSGRWLLSRTFFTLKKTFKTYGTNFGYSVVGVSVAEKMRVKLDYILKVRSDIFLLA